MLSTARFACGDTPVRTRVIAPGFVGFTSRAVTIALAAASLGPLSNAAAQAGPPNILVIVADDMGYADIGVHGSNDIPTPHIDALAAGGIRFTDAYVSGPFCSPTRAGLMTGRYPQRFGHEFNIGIIRAHRDVGLPLDEVTIAERLRAAGYRTALIGKWHLGTAPRFRPTQRGFDEFFGFRGGTHRYTDPMVGVHPIEDGNEIVTDITYLTDDFTDRAVAFIRRESLQPFFLYLAFSAVHVPLEATEKYLARFPEIADEGRRTYAAMLSAMDDGVGRTLAALRDAGVEENTLVLFFNDNGGPTANASINSPLRGAKGDTWEGGIRVPFIISWKGRLPAGQVDSRPIIQLDVLPTVLAAAGIEVQPEWQLDGVNLLPFLDGAAAGTPHDALYWRVGGIMAIRKGDWKLVLMSEGGQHADPTELSDVSGAELYNVRTDIGERNDLAKAHPQKVRELAEAWRRWSVTLSTPGWPPVPARSPEGSGDEPAPRAGTPPRTTP